MSDFSISDTFQSDQPITKMELEHLFHHQMLSNFSKVKSKETADGLILSGRVKTALFNPVASFKGTLKIHTRNDKCRYIFEGTVGTNGWFWATLLLFLVLFFPLIIVLIVMYSSQKKKIREEMDRLKSAIQFSVDLD